MGVRRLEKKDELRYRKGSTNESRNCKWCRYFLRDEKQTDQLTIGRCKIMGLALDRKYRIREDFTCNVQATTYRNPFGR